MTNSRIVKGSVRSLGFILPALLSIVFASNVFAIEYGGFGGRPAYPRADNPRTESIFVHTLNPGDVQEEGVLTVNNSTETKTILVYAVDSTPSTGGAFACAQASVTSKDVGAWITLAKSEVTLAPGTNELVPFTIIVPWNASVGEHNGCIVMQEKKEVSQASGANLSLRTGLRVAITIPGELERKLEIVGFTMSDKDAGGYVLQPKVKNLGNVSIDADVKVTTRYFFGLTYFSHGGQNPILRGDTSEWNFELAKPFWGGWYTSSFAVEYDESPDAGVGVKSGDALVHLKGPSLTFFSFPTPAGLALEILFLALAASGGFLFWLARKRKRWIQTSWVSYGVEAGDDMQMLAARFDVSWKLLAKVNAIRPPYTLSSGQTIRVPPQR